MDLTTLRQLVVSVVVPELIGNTHQQLADACMSLSLPEPSGEGTKRERVSQSFAALPDADLPIVAEQILMQTLAGASTRNAIQDVLWAEGSLEMPKRTRREIARDLDLADLLHNVDRFTVLLGRLWVLDDDPFSWLGESTNSLRDRIERHVFHKPRDWSTEELFEQLGAFEATRRQVHTIPGGAGLCRYTSSAAHREVYYRDSRGIEPVDEFIQAPLIRNCPVCPRVPPCMQVTYGHLDRSLGVSPGSAS